MRAAIYESDITPPLGCYQTGYGFPRYANEVYHKLFAKSLVVEDNGNCAVIISIDICEYPREMTDIITKRIFEYTGIPAENICIHSTHTHFGASVSDDPAIDCYADTPYKDVFYRLVADSAILAYKRLQDAELSFGKIEVPGIANSRCSILKDGTLKSFERDPSKIQRPITEPDHQLPVLFIEQNGKKIGALYSFSCHQDTMHKEISGYSGDYSSEVSKLLKDNYGADFISIYLAAPSGDINNFNPYEDQSERKFYSEIATLLADGIIKTESSLRNVGNGVSVIKKSIDIPKRKYNNEEFCKLAKYLIDTDKGCSFRLSNLVFYQTNTTQEPEKVYVQIIKIGEFALFVYPGEMFVEYSHRTKKNSPFRFNMVAENSNAYGGYIPVPEAFGDKGLLYETSPAYDSFLVPEAGEILYKEIMNIAQEIK